MKRLVLLLILGAPVATYGLTEQDVADKVLQVYVPLQQLSLEERIIQFQVQAAKAPFQWQWVLDSGTQVSAYGQEQWESKSFAGPKVTSKTRYGTQVDISAKAHAGEPNLVDTKVSVEQPLLKGRSPQINQSDLIEAHEAQRRFELQYLEQQSKAILDGLSQWSQWQLAVNRLAHAEQSLDQAQRLYESVKQRIQAGRLGQTEYAQANLSLQQAQIEYEKAFTNASHIKQELMLMLDIEDEDEVSIEENVSLLPELNPVQWYQNKALTHARVFLEQPLDMSRADRKLMSAKDGTRPDLKLQVSAKKKVRSELKAEPGEFTTGVQFTMPITGSASNRLAVAKATVAKQQLRTQQAYDNKKFELNMLHTFEEAQSRLKQITLTEQAQRNAEKSFEDALLLFEAGRVGLSEVIQLKERADEAQLKMLEAKLAYLMQVYQLEHDSGIFLERWHV